MKTRITGLITVTTAVPSSTSAGHLAAVDADVPATDLQVGQVHLLQTQRPGPPGGRLPLHGGVPLLDWRPVNSDTLHTAQAAPTTCN